MTYQDVGLPPQFSVSKGDVYKQEFLPMILWLLAMLWSFPLVQGYYSLIAAKIFFFSRITGSIPTLRAPVVKSCHRWKRVKES